MWSMGVITYNMLSGQQPFGHRRFRQKHKVRQNPNFIFYESTRPHLTFETKYWGSVSEEAKVNSTCRRSTRLQSYCKRQHGIQKLLAFSMPRVRFWVVVGLRQERFSPLLYCCTVCM